MTSKISFSKLVRTEMRQMNWLLAVQMVAFVLVFPFRTLMVMAIRQNEQVNYGRATYSVAEQFSRNVGLGHMENTGVILCAGILCALAAFAYIHSQTKQDFYHSLALKREGLFGAKYVSSTLTFVIPYLISQLLVILVGLFYQAATLKVVLEILLASVQGILFFLCSYAMTLVAMMLTGNFLTTMLGIGVFGAYLPIMNLIVESFQEVFWDTRIADYTYSSAYIQKWSSPWAWCMYATGRKHSGTTGVTGQIPGVGDLCQLVAIAAVLTLVALALYRVRKTEAGGRALAFPPLEPVIKILVMVPVSLVAGLIANQMIESVAFELLFILLFGALICVVIEFIYRVDIRQVLAHKWQFAVGAVLACAIFFAFRFDVTGYNSYLPAEDELQSMSLTSYFGTYIAYDDEGGIAYSRTMRERLDAIEWEDFDSIYQLAADAVEIEKGNDADEDLGQDYSYVYFKFHLTNGKEVYRCYRVNTEQFNEVMNELIRNEEFLEMYYPICNWDEEIMSKITSIYCWFYGYDEEELFGEPEEDADTEDADTEDADTENLNAEDAEDVGAESELSEDAVSAESESLTEMEETVTDEPEDAEDTASAASTVSGNVEYYYTDVYTDINITVPVSMLSELVEAYVKDLKSLSYEEIRETVNEINFYYEQTYVNESYPINENFTNTLEVLKKVYYGQ
ncbi:MAG: DUF6449 domain-containing protein [Lachnospiraceae bacterium]|nr:DUF6449 domain-containing protein [Lachnospiraceae bacterium]